MRFLLSDGNGFDIPDIWWDEAGMASFKLTSKSYPARPHAGHAQHPITVVPLSTIKPIYRNPGVTLDFGGFEHDRMVRVLKWIAEREPMEPVQVKLRREDGYDYAIYDGFHRFHAAIAAGFTHLPVIIDNWGIPDDFFSSPSNT